MKKILVGLLLLGTIVVSTAPVFAETTCLCVGITAQSAYCGNSIGGNHLKVVHNPSEATFQKMLHTTAMATFKIRGWSLDDSTGWLCWKGAFNP